MSIRQSSVIGGEFETGKLKLGTAMELAKLTHGLRGTWTLSGRAAFVIMLRQLQAKGFNHIHLPAYLCRSILLPVQEMGIKYSFYPVDADLTAQADPPNEAGVLLIHYFGWLNPATSSLRAESGSSLHLIEDATHALLSEWRAAVGQQQSVFFSSRKFGPSPLGGWANIKTQPIDVPNEVEALLWQSMAARLLRAAYLSEADAGILPGLESFYLSAFQAVEDFLDQHPTSMGLPQNALDIISGADWQKIATQRRANWKILHDLLVGQVELVNENLPDEVVPIGFVIRTKKRDFIRDRLAAQRIYCPVHWQLPPEVSAKRFPVAARLSDTCLTLPIDQRYGCNEMERLAAAVKELV